MTAITPPQMPVANPGCYPCFWPTSYRLKVPTTFLGSINLLEQLTKLRETFYLPDCQIIIYKWCNSEIARWKWCIGLNMGERYGTSMSMPFPGTLVSQNLLMFTNPEVLWTQSFWMFMKDSLHRHGWANHWPLVMDLTFSPFVFSTNQGVGLKVPTLFPWLLTRQLALILSSFPKGISLT